MILFILSPDLNQPPLGSGLFGLVRTKELLLRWAEYSVFSPIMRTHEVQSCENNRSYDFLLQGNEPESFHQFYSDEDTMVQFGRLTQIFTALKNYTKVGFTFPVVLFKA